LKVKEQLSQIEEKLKATEKSNANELLILKKEIDNQKEELIKQKSEIRKSKRAIFVILISIILFIVVLISIEAWSEIKLILAGITGLGGLWGFFSLIINVYKMTKD